MFVVDDGHIDVLVLLCPFPSHIGVRLRIHVVGWAVTKISRKMNTRGNAFVNLYQRFQGFLLAFITSDSYVSLGFLVLFLLHFVFVIGVVSKQHPFSKRTHALDACSSKTDGKVASVRFLSGCNNSRSGFPVSVCVSILFLTEANEHGFSTLASDKRHCRFCFSFEVTVCKNSVNL